MNEFASSGSYYFKSGLLAKKYIDLSLKKNNSLIMKSI